MADKLNDLAGRLGKGPRGLGTGLKVLAAAGAAAYGISQSMYTGKVFRRVVCSRRPKVMALVSLVSRLM